MNNDSREGRHVCDGVKCLTWAEWVCLNESLHKRPKLSLTYWCDKCAKELQSKNHPGKQQWDRLSAQPAGSAQE